MRDTRLRCDCCGQYESTTGCVRGVVNCPCEIEQNSFHLTLECPDCKKCPAHCKCDLSKCTCERKPWDAQMALMLRSRGLSVDVPHQKDCPVSEICRLKVRKAKAELEVEWAEMRLNAALNK